MKRFYRVLIFSVAVAFAVPVKAEICVYSGSDAVSTATIVPVDLPQPVGVPYGSKDVAIFQFSVHVGSGDGILVQSVAPELYERVYGELVPPWSLANIRLVDEKGVLVGTSQIFHYSDEQEDYRYHSSYTMFYGSNMYIPACSTKTFTILADIPADSPIGGVKVALYDMFSLGSMFSDGIKSRFGFIPTDTPVSGKAIGSRITFH